MASKLYKMCGVAAMVNLRHDLGSIRSGGEGKQEEVQSHATAA